MEGLQTMKYKILFLCFIILSGCAYVKKDMSLKGMPPDAPVQNIHITAKRYKYTPDVVLVKQGTHVILEIESLDAKHGFQIDQYGINVTIPEKAKVTVEFYAWEPGTYPFKCSHFCGFGHFGMKGKIIVE